MGSRCFADNEGSSERMAIRPQSAPVQFRKTKSWFIVHSRLNEKMEMPEKELDLFFCGVAVISSFRREMATERKLSNLTRSRYLWIYLLWLDAFVGISARGEGSDGYPFQTSVFGTKIQLTLQLITLARIEGTARVDFKLICMWVKPGGTSYSC